MSKPEIDLNTMEEKKSLLHLPTSSLTIVIFLFMMTITGGVYRLVNYNDFDTSLLREFAIIGSSILISFIMALVIKRVRS